MKIVVGKQTRAEVVADWLVDKAGVHPDDAQNLVERVEDEERGDLSDLEFLQEVCRPTMRLSGFLEGYIAAGQVAIRPRPEPDIVVKLMDLDVPAPHSKRIYSTAEMRRVFNLGWMQERLKAGFIVGTGVGETRGYFTDVPMRHAFGLLRDVEIVTDESGASSVVGRLTTAGFPMGNLLEEMGQPIFGMRALVRDHPDGRTEISSIITWDLINTVD